MTTDRTRLKFSQRYGYEDLPEPMRLEQISDGLRREIWDAVRELLLGYRVSGFEGYYFHVDGERLFERVLGSFTRLPQENVETDYRSVMDTCRKIALKISFNKVLDFLEILIDEQKGSHVFVHKMKHLFEKHGAAYTLDMSPNHCRFLPCATKEQGDATQHALKTLREGGMKGAATHLRKAADHINAGRFADSIRDSMHAVESAARVLSPKDSKTLKPALDSLEKAGVLKHPALKEAFSKLYGYTSNQEGIRHALLESGAADVDLQEAIFMFGACASFAAYLTGKHRQVKGS